MTAPVGAGRRLKRPRPPTQLAEEEGTTHGQWQPRTLRFDGVGFDGGRRPLQQVSLEQRVGDAPLGAGASRHHGSFGDDTTRRPRAAAASPADDAFSWQQRRRRIGGRQATTRALAATALTLTLVRAVAAAAASPMLGEQQQRQHKQFRPAPAVAAAASLSSRLCSPSEGSRAYVTTIANNGGGGGGGDMSGDRLLGARVLAQSLRSAGAKGEVVVLVPQGRASAAVVDSLRRDGLTVRIVPEGLRSAGGEIVPEELMTKVFLWSLSSFDRLVFLDPRSLIQKNPDALFACEGFCAAGAVYSHSPFSSEESPLALAHLGLAADSSDDDDYVNGDDGHQAAAAAAAALEKPLSAPRSWQPSTSVMVLEPSLEVHKAMLGKLAETPSVGSLEAQVFLSSFLLDGGTDAGDRCVPFEDPVETAASPDRRRGDGGGGDVEPAGVGGREFGGEGRREKTWGGGNGRDQEAGGLGGALEDALMPVVLLNGPHIPRCAPERKRTAEGVCQRLPYTFAAPSTDFNGWGGWGAREDQGAVPEPHIIHFPDEDAPWKRLAYLHKPLFWKWNAYREQLEYPYGNFFAQWILFFIPCVVLASARVYYKTRSGGGGRGDESRRNGGGSGAVTPTEIRLEESSAPNRRGAPYLRSPARSAQRQQQQQVAILPPCGMASAYDGAVASTGVFGSLEAASGAARCRNSSDGSGSSLCIAVGADHPRSAYAPHGVGGAGGGAGGGRRLPVKVCYLLSAVVGGFGLLWFRASRALAREVVDASWHPVITVSVHDAWLYCALVLGLYVMDYAYFALRTGFKTLLKDSVAVVVFVTAVRVLHSTTAAAGDSGGGGGVVWAGAIGVGVIALGFCHGSRAGLVPHLSGRAHFRCVTASCVVGTVVSMAMCLGGAEGAVTYQEAASSRRAQSAVATVQMVFIALVYASVIVGMDQGAVGGWASKVGRPCLTAGSPLAADAFVTAATGKGLPSSASSAALVAEEAAAAAASMCGNAAVREGRPGGGGGPGAGASGGGKWRLACSLLARGPKWAAGVVWRRRRIAACVFILWLWKVYSQNLRPEMEGLPFEKYGQSCLESQAGSGYVEAGRKSLVRVCGAEQALRPVSTGAYFEAFRQDKVCLEVAGGGFLSLRRVHVSPACLPEFQFVFQKVGPTGSSGTKSHRGAGATGAGAGADDREFCAYNPTSGLYLSAQGRPQAQCGPMEHWRVRPAPPAPGLKGGGNGPLSGSSGSTVSALLHPSYLSRGPLHTFYGYVLAATVLLIARAVFSMLATSPCAGAAATSRGSGSSGGGGSGGSKHHRGLSARQRSRRTHSRSHGSFASFADAGYLGDAGYAGDAETGGAGYGGGGCGGGCGGSGNCSSSSGGGGGRARSSHQAQPGGLSGSSVSPVSEGRHHRVNAGWTTEVMAAANFSDDRRFSGEAGVGGGRSTRPHLKRRSSSAAAAGSTEAAACGGWLAKLLSGLVVVCDAMLLAGLWCLVPAHFAQAMSALTLDHHSAIDQGLGMDSNANAALSNGGWTRSLGEGAGARAEYTIFVEGGGRGEGDPAESISCDTWAWWLLSALVRWHLLLLLLAFCHLHGAVTAASTAARWRVRRKSKKAKAVTSAEHRRPSGAFWGLRCGERLAMRLRTAMGVLTLLCAAAAATGPELGGVLSGLPFSGLHAHPGWGRCGQAAGLDESWGGVSPLLVFAVLAAAAGVYVRAGSSFAVRCCAGLALPAVWSVAAAAAGREYLALALTALAMDWVAWAIAGGVSCVCYLSESGNDDLALGPAPSTPPRLVEWDTSGSSGSLRDLAGGDVGGDGDSGARVGDAARVGGDTSGKTAGGSGLRQRINDAARRISPKGWVVGLRGRAGQGLVAR